jgi:predicted ferric reductase
MDGLKDWAQWLGWVGFTSFTFSLLLSIRTHWLDRLGDGLDKVYRCHHWLGVTAFCALVTHLAILSLRWLGSRPLKAAWFPFPVHPRLSVNLGSYAFWLLAVLIALTAWRRFPYHLWRLTHKLMGVAYLLGASHVVLSARAEAKFAILPLAAVGTLAWLWDVAIGPACRRWTRCQIVNIERPTPHHLIVQLRPPPIPMVPGQYLFTRFVHLSHEPHPFTPWRKGELLHMSIKVSGDFTAQLHRELRTGMEVDLGKPFGTFDYRRGLPQQIWIAGGVGIAPFLAWMQAELDLEEATLFYCVHDRQQAVHQGEIERMTAEVSTIRSTTVCTGEEGHLTAARIAEQCPEYRNRSIFLCGPPKMVRDLRRQLRALGCPPQQIHSEVFAFRRGAK